MRTVSCAALHCAAAQPPLTASTDSPGCSQPPNLQTSHLLLLRAVQARTLLPGLPQVDEKLLSAARAGLFQNMLLGGMMSDMIQV